MAAGPFEAGEQALAEKVAAKYAVEAKVA